MDERLPDPHSQDKGDELLEAARRRGRGLLDRQKSAAGDELHSVADVMREAAKKFEEREEGGLAGYAGRAADMLDGLSTKLRERNLDELLKDAESALRTRPVVGLAVALGVGFCVGRFLRAAAPAIARKAGASDESAEPPPPTEASQSAVRGTDIMTTDVAPEAGMDPSGNPKPDLGTPH